MLGGRFLWGSYPNDAWPKLRASADFEAAQRHGGTETLLRGAREPSLLKVPLQRLVHSPTVHINFTYVEIVRFRKLQLIRPLSYNGCEIDTKGSYVRRVHQSTPPGNLLKMML